MGKYLLDSSAVLAVLFEERGADKVVPLLQESSIHAVQVAEIVKKLRDHGVPADKSERLIGELALPVIEGLKAEEAFHSRRYCLKGLSLGDRICLVIAECAGLTAVTADARWKKVVDEEPTLALKVMLIRSVSH